MKNKTKELRKNIPHIITIFNNKGGVGKTMLTFHLAHALGEMGIKVLLVDLDPQCNLTIFSLDMETIHTIWAVEDSYIDDFSVARSTTTPEKYNRILTEARSVHFLLKPTEDGTAELDRLPPPVQLGQNVDLIPGRLTLHLYEGKISERWSGIYQGDPLSIRTATRVRAMAHEYAAQYGYQIILFDTSPSLGSLNRHLLSLADGFVIPCLPDLFSLYGIRNIGNALNIWRKQFDSIFHFLSDAKRDQFPTRFVQFIGYTIYNARKYSGGNNPLDLAQAQYNYAKQIPSTIEHYISEKNRSKIDIGLLNESIGGRSVIHTHNTLPNSAQKYHKPIWKLPNCQLEPEDRSTIMGNQAKYLETKQSYSKFADDFLKRVEALNA